MIFYVIIILIFISIVFFRTKTGQSIFSKIEPATFLKGFEMIHDFELIQGWNVNDSPVAVGRLFGSLIKQDVYVAIGTKNNKTYLIIKEVNSAPFAFNTQYIYLEKSSVENLKKYINLA